MVACRDVHPPTSWRKAQLIDKYGVEFCIFPDNDASFFIEYVKC